jgi:UDP-glucose 4-epimerase
VFDEFAAEGGIWAVVHLAALKAVGESGEIPLAYYRVNVGGSISLMEVGRTLLNIPSRHVFPVSVTA